MLSDGLLDLGIVAFVDVAVDILVVVLVVVVFLNVKFYFFITKSFIITVSLH